VISWHEQWSRPWESPWGLSHTLAWYNKVTLREALTALTGRVLSTDEVRRAISPCGGSWWTSADGHARTPQGRGVMAALQARLGEQGVTASWCRGTVGLLEVTPRICPKCIRRGYHSVLHQLAGLARCPLDGALLTCDCPACGATFGDPKIVAARGFACAHCQRSLMDDDGLHLPGDNFSTSYFACLDDVARWAVRIAECLHIDEQWPGLVFYTPTKEGPAEISRAAALLPMMAPLVPYPGDVSHLGPRIGPLRFVIDPSRDAQRVAISLEDTLRIINAVASDIYSELGEHADCFEKGAFLFRRHGFDRDHVPWSSDFCVRAYAYLIWKRRVANHVRWAPKFASIGRYRLYPSAEDLAQAVRSSYYHTLHELAAQQDRARAGLEVLAWEVLQCSWLTWVGTFEASYGDAGTGLPTSALCLSFERPDNYLNLPCDQGANVDRHFAMMERAFSGRRAPAAGRRAGPEATSDPSDDVSRQGL